MSKNVKPVNPMKVITGPETRWSYANVWEPKSINGGTPKYSVSLIIPKSDTRTVAKIKAAIEAAYKEGETKLKGNGKTVPALSVLKTPLRDAVGVLTCSHANAFHQRQRHHCSGIVDADRNPIMSRSRYSGVYGRVTLPTLSTALVTRVARLNNLRRFVTVSLGGKPALSRFQHG